MILIYDKGKEEYISKNNSWIEVRAYSRHTHIDPHEHQGIHKMLALCEILLLQLGSFMSLGPEIDWCFCTYV